MASGQKRLFPLWSGDFRTWTYSWIRKIKSLKYTHTKAIYTNSYYINLFFAIKGLVHTKMTILSPYLPVNFKRETCSDGKLKYNKWIVRAQIQKGTKTFLKQSMCLQWFNHNVKNLAQEKKSNNFVQLFLCCNMWRTFPRVQCCALYACHAQFLRILSNNSWTMHKHL